MYYFHSRSANDSQFSQPVKFRYGTFPSLLSILKIYLFWGPVRTVRPVRPVRCFVTPLSWVVNFHTFITRLPKEWRNSAVTRMILILEIETFHNKDLKKTKLITLKSCCYAIFNSNFAHNLRRISKYLNFNISVARYTGINIYRVRECWSREFHNGFLV